MGSRTSAETLNPLPPDPARHQLSAIPRHGSAWRVRREDRPHGPEGGPPKDHGFRSPETLIDSRPTSAGTNRVNHAAMGLGRPPNLATLPHSPHKLPFESGEEIAGWQQSGDLRRPFSADTETGLSFP